MKTENSVNIDMILTKKEVILIVHGGFISYAKVCITENAKYESVRKEEH